MSSSITNRYFLKNTREYNHSWFGDGKRLFVQVIQCLANLNFYLKVKLKDQIFRNFLTLLSRVLSWVFGLDNFAAPIYADETIALITKIMSAPLQPRKIEKISFLWSFNNTHKEKEKACK